MRVPLLLLLSLTSCELITADQTIMQAATYCCRCRLRRSRRFAIGPRRHPAWMRAAVTAASTTITVTTASRSRSYCGTIANQKKTVWNCSRHRSCCFWIKAAASDFVAESCCQTFAVKRRRSHYYWPSMIIRNLQL